jgi:uncharacterized protein (TIGR00369 family)
MRNGGGGPSALAGGERCGARVAADPPTGRTGVVPGQLGHVVAPEDVVDERRGLGRQQLDDVVERVAAALVARVLRRHDQVDAERQVADLALDPRQVDLELLGRVGDRTQHPEAARLRHRRHHVAAVGEGEDRQLDPEQVGDGGAHPREVRARRGRRARPRERSFRCLYGWGVRADQYEPLPADKVEGWVGGFGERTASLFPGLVGLVVEDARQDYARMRLPYRPELRQPGGVVHGGAIATLIDTVVVPALAWVYDEVPKLLTVTLNIRFRGALFEEDAVAEGWIDTRGRTTVFCSAEVVGATSGRVVADGQLVYKVPPPS